jgi:hypothetical protein
MKKLLLILTISCISIITVNAQSKSDAGIVWGAGLNLGLPLGNFGDISTFGIGVKLQGEKMFTDQVSGLASIGYTDFFGKSTTLDFGNGPQTYKYPSVSLIPILVGGRYYASPTFFLGAEIGVAFLSGGSGSGSSGFDIKPQAGYNTDMYQIVIAYNVVSESGGSLDHLDLSFIYKFNSGK